MSSSEQDDTASVASTSTTISTQSVSTTPSETPTSTPKTPVPQQPNTIFFAGPLRKLGQLNKSFKKRHFVLNNHSLSYFKSAQTITPIQSIPLKYAHIQDSVKFAQHEASFEIVTSHRIYYLVAENLEEKRLWMRELAAVCEGRSMWREALEQMEWRIRRDNLKHWGRLGTRAPPGAGDTPRQEETLDQRMEREIREWIEKEWEKAEVLRDTDEHPEQEVLNVNA